MKATKIKMKSKCQESNNLCEIDSIYLKEAGMFYEKEAIHDHLLKYPKSICVNIYPYPLLQPVVSVQGEKYVHSTPDSTQKDNLLNLPRC